ncbi:MAG: BTAD domain-containing putative transcriptional regulator [Candidatus Devosia phytovorans]|uniref:BTAD domain-containing putative transcriptional regulator n=1 Tax=Candidatus Devosia phytovorans TaxID=3121372 RepID=A0AAJ5VW51_9HYPH|nr:BTAD domain-containing putative transcriptional regulator [Devosia sp.]WEK04503.1 MAG: BTAD domain-containing putative transcriptional regulator [Devosia sp.]
MSMQSAQFHLDLLGPFEARFEGGEPIDLKLKSERLMLSWLALRPRQSGSREEIAALLWSERSDAQAYQSLRQTLAALRRALGGKAQDLLRIDREKVMLVAGAVGSDVAFMLGLVANSAVEELERAAAQYRGEFLEGLNIRDPLVQQWLEDRRVELRVAAVQRFEWLLSAYARSGRHADAEAIASRLIEIDPLAEEGYRALIRVYLARGERAMALRHYRRCRDVLARNLSVEPSEETKALMRLASEPQISTAVAVPPRDLSLERSQRVHNLPRPMTSLVGRERTVEEVVERLGIYRLVTVTGAGGAGKTRIAVETGFRLDGTFADGVWLVELAGIADPQLIGEALCGALGVPVSLDRPAVESAVAYLAQRQALLILDNCEHVVAQSAQLAEMVLASCPSVAVLATSRESLGVAGESLYRVPRLTYPAEAEGISAEAAIAFSAVQLFVDRAAAVVEQFTLDDAVAPAVASICMQVEGIPLAIELAVGRLKMMRPERLAADLSSSLLTLRRSTRAGHKHHETLRAMLDWSYALLQPDEQTFLRRLAVFAGGCSLASAMQVARGGTIEEDAVFDLLSSLVEKSLLSVDLSEAEPRYRLLETTRQYALQRQRESGEQGRQRALADYLVARFDEAGQSWAGTPTLTWLGRYEPEVDNLRASLDWAFGAGGDMALGMDLVSLSVRLWDELSLFREKERWVETAMTHLHDDLPPAIAARLYLAKTSNSAHGNQSFFAYAEQASQLFRSAGRAVDLGEALARAGATLLTIDTIVEALPYLEDALKVLEPLGPTKPLASCLRSKGIAAYLGGDIAAAQTSINRSMAVCRSIGDTRGLASAQIALAEMDFVAGKVESAIEGIRYMLDGSGHNHRQAALGLSNLGAYLLAHGKTAEARDAAREGLRVARALGWPAAVVRAGEHLALVAVLGGELELAARLSGYAREFYARGVSSREWTEEVTHRRLVAELSEQLSAAQLEGLMAEGAAWSEPQAAEAAETIGGLRFSRA